MRYATAGCCHRENRHAVRGERGNGAVNRALQSRQLSLHSLSLLCLWIGFAGIAQAAETAAEQGEIRARIEPHGFIYGGALGIRSEIYSGYDRRVIPLPVIGYRGEKLQVFGPFVRYQLADAGALDVDIRVNPRFGGFDESDSEIFRGMAAREFSMDLGFGLTWKRDDWKIELANLHDVLDRSNGQEWTLSLGRAFSAGPVFVEPSVGLSHVDSAHVDYYYGVAATEAASFRPAYAGESALNTRFGISLMTPVLFGGLTRLGIEHTRFDASIADSPLTDTDASTSIYLAFSTFFDR